MDDTCYIPQDVWPDILKLVPVKTLLRWRCVCRTWYYLIGSEVFMTSHFLCYTRNKRNSVLLYRHFSNRPRKREEYYLLADSTDGSDEEANLNLQVRQTFTCPFLPGLINQYYFRIVGSVDGLLCVCEDVRQANDSTVLVWNPLIHKYIKLPEVLDLVCNMEYYSVFGFGYDSQTSDYKVVRMDFFILERFALPAPALKIHIYSVVEGTWKIYLKSFYMNLFICEKWWSQCFVDGYINWVAWTRDIQNATFTKSCLLRFHVETEEFDAMDLPEELQHVYPVELHVSEYKGKLAVVYCTLKRQFIGNEMQLYELWTFSDDVLSPWQKEASFNLDSQPTTLRWIQCSLKNGDLLGFTEDGELTSFDARTGQTNGLALSGRRRSWYTTSFTDSLVLMNSQQYSGVRSYNNAPQDNQRYLFAADGTLTLQDEGADESTDDTDGQNIAGWVQLLLEDQLFQFVGGNEQELQNLLPNIDN